MIDGKEGVVGIPFFDGYVEKAAIEFLDDAAKTPDKPFFINVNFMKVHQPNMPAPEFEHKSLSKSKYADSVVELDTRIGRIMDKLRETGLDKNTLVFYTTDNGAWQDVYPDAGYTPFRGTKGTVREGGNRVPAIAVWPGKIKPGSKNHEIVGGLDLMATFASVAGVELPENDREGKPIIFDSYRHDAGADRHRQVAAQVLVLLHRERALARRGPRQQLQVRVQPARRRRRRRPAAWRSTRNLGWKGAGEVRRHGAAGLRPVAGPAGALRHLHEQLHRADLRWASVMGEEIKKIMATYVEYPPRKLQSVELHRPDHALQTTSGSSGCGSSWRRKA